MIREAAILHRLALAVRRALLTTALLLAFAGTAQAHTLATAPTAVTAAVTEPCPGDPIRIDQLTTGSFESSLQGGYVLVPFDVPAGTTAVRVKYCFDQPEVPTPNVRHTLDLGIYDPRGFRGWGGSSHPGRHALARGLLDRGRVPRQAEGPRAGQDHARLPARADPPRPLVRRARPRRDRRRALGDADDRVAWRVEVEYSSDPAFADQPYRKTRYSTKPKRKKAGWYTGDLHVHAEHSALGDATMRETFGYAFGQAKLDFITLTDYVTDSAWGEIGRYKDRPPPRRALLGGHHLPRPHEQPALGPLRRLPHRPGLRAARRRRDDAAAAPRSPRAGSCATSAARAASRRSTTRRSSRRPTRCSRCSAAAARGTTPPQETNYKLVDAIEVNTGPQKIGEAPNPFTSHRDRLLRAGARQRGAARRGARRQRLPQRGARRPARASRRSASARPSCTPSELSEKGIRCAVKAGHTYAKIGGSSGADLRFTGRVPGARKRAIFGDAARGRSLKLAAKATGGDVLQLLRDGSVIATGSGSIARTVTESGRYGLRLMDGQVTEAVGTPIWFRAAKRGRVSSRGC